MAISAWIATVKHRPRKSLLFAGVLVTSSLFAGVCGDREFYHPLTDGDGTRYPLDLSIAIWEVLGPVVPVPATDGRTHLAYVIQLTDKSPSPMGVDSFEVVDPDKGNQVTGTNQVVTISGTNVTAKVQPFILKNPLVDADYTTVLGAGQAGSMYFDVTYPDRQSVPAHISHQVTVTDQTSSATYTAIDEPINIESGPVVLSPPLKGKGWLDANGCCITITPHRGGVEPINGKARAPEMFAIDFQQLDANGRVFEGPVNELSSYPFYGTDIYSAAAGKVVEVVRDLPNGTPGQDPTNPTADTASGNHVIVDIGRGRYVLYAHMIPGSVTVSVDDEVPVGYVLGKLGDSGNASAPHLHFQVMDRPSALGAHGLPFVFDSMDRQATVLGTVSDELNNIGDGTPLQLDTSTAKHFDKSLPLTLDVLCFQ
jgi:Peptidase family M23